MGGMDPQWWAEVGQFEQEQRAEDERAKEKQMKVYEAINAVQTALSRSGISKDRQGPGFKFRGVDDVYNALAPLLAEHKLCILPRIVGRECVERESAAGKALFYVTVEAEFDFVSAEDGSRHTVRTFGEAMDSSDKATNKAMSAAYKYAAFQTFAIPTEADNDADAHAHQPLPRQQPARDYGEELTALREAAALGMAALRDVFLSLPPEAAAALEDHKNRLKSVARQADEQKQAA